ncbi:hypothetical protein KPH14_003042 [Odynerus spinipes]|uniref:Uncharacterized protein n=1 Tax=Odynerus spinipes TaxID=1348599 RepID=A0AAD9RWN8_9HYME|nr:hypothetical protein KPH14_003042 [Odynerus spinipes]
MNKIEFFREALKHIRIETEDGADRITKEGVLPLTEDGVPIRKLFISNIAQRTTYKDLSAAFSKYGVVESCYLKRNNGQSNYAFITFNTIEAAIRARQDGSRKEINIHDRDLRVMPADSWHQPDSIKNKSFTLAKDWNKCHKKSPAEEVNEDCIQNYPDALIDALNDDCLMHIFLYLPIIDRIVIERVCKRWRAVSQESWRTVKKLDFSSDTCGFSQKHILISTANLREVLIRCGRFLTHIDFSETYHFLNRTALLITSRFCPNLQTVDITKLHVFASGIMSLAKNCKNIKELSLGYSSISDRDLMALFVTNKGLRYLNFLGTNISGRCLSFLSPDTFTKLVLDSCHNIRDSHFASALANLKNLESLTMKNCICFTKHIMETIGECCTNLKKFDAVPFTVMMPRDALQITRLVNLTVLRLWQCYFIDNDFLITLAAECQQLIYLDISDCCIVSDRGLQAVATLPKLETLLINFLDQVTAVGLDNMYNIKHLECQKCTLITDTGLAILIHVSPNLELLDLSGCIGITNETINVAMSATSRRSNNTFLKMFVGGTSVKFNEIHETSPYLLVVNVDFSYRKMPSHILDF